MVVITLHKFKRYRGLYFWGIQVASCGILVYANSCYGLLRISSTHSVDVNLFHDWVVRHGHR